MVTQQTFAGSAQAYDCAFGASQLLTFAEAELLPPKDPYRVDMAKTDFELFRDHMSDLDKDTFDDVPPQH